MNDPNRHPLFLVEHEPSVQAEEETALMDADGLVVDAARCPDPQEVRAAAPPLALLCSDPAACAAWREREGVHWVGVDGLEQTARLRDAWPAQRWLPRLSVYKPVLSFRFSDEFHGEGFKFYRPDTAAIRGYQVIGGEMVLQAALDRAKELDFETVWLFGMDAELRRFGLDLEMLERARGGWDGDLWISGGAAAPRHLENLVREGGAAGVVVSEAVVNRWGSTALRDALVAPTPVAPAEAPLHFTGREMG